MDFEFAKWLASLGVGGALAGMMFAIYRKDMKESSARLNELVNQWRGQTELLVQVVRDNTAAMTQNTLVVQSLHEHMTGGDRRVGGRP